MDFSSLTIGDIVALIAIVIIAMSFLISSIVDSSSTGITGAGEIKKKLMEDIRKSK